MRDLGPPAPLRVPSPIQVLVLNPGVRVLPGFRTRRAKRSYQSVTQDPSRSPIERMESLRPLLRFRVLLGEDSEEELEVVRAS
jgi:hypothetical protein